jgi:hypothetical protein
MHAYGLPLRATLLMGLLGCTTIVHAQEHSSFPVANFGVPVSHQRLAAIRGGFDLGDGLEVSFGIQRAVYVDGNLMAYINVSIPDMAHVTPQQAISLAAALGTINVQVGQGNTFSPTSVAQAEAKTPTMQGGGNAQTPAPAVQPGSAVVIQTPQSHVLASSTIIPASATQASAATVIQNTVDNQVISSLTTLNVTVNTLNAMHNQGLQQSLQAVQQLQSLSH